jgi:hypothetical protein
MVSPPPLETNKDEIGIPPMHNGIQKPEEMHMGN